MSSFLMILSISKINILTLLCSQFCSPTCWPYPFLKHNSSSYIFLQAVMILLLLPCRASRFRSDLDFPCRSGAVQWISDSSRSWSSYRKKKKVFGVCLLMVSDILGTFNSLKVRGPFVQRLYILASRYDITFTPLSIEPISIGSWLSMLTRCSPMNFWWP